MAIERNTELDKFQAIVYVLLVFMFDLQDNDKSSFTHSVNDTLILRHSAAF